MVLKNPKNIYIHMNYRDFYKNNSISKRFKHLIPEGVDEKEFEMGFKDEKGEHGMDDAEAAKTTRDHLKKDPNYYSKMKKCGLEEKELLKGINLESDCCDDGLPMRDDGALDIEHDGRPIRLSKIVQIGAIGGGMADGEVSGMTNVGVKDAAKAAGDSKDGKGIKVGADHEPITAGGKSVDSSLASKTVGAEVVPGEGQEQGGPNTKGSISGTPKIERGNEQGNGLSLSLQEAKSKIRSMVKEALKEITFNKDSGRWERLNEGHKSGCECGFCKNKGTFGKKEEKDDVDENVDMKTGPSYKVMPNPTLQTPGSQDLPRIQSYEPEITEVYDEEKERSLQERYTELATAQRNLSESELDELKDLGMKIETYHNNKPPMCMNCKKNPMTSDSGFCDKCWEYMKNVEKKGKNKEVDTDYQIENSVNMRMGPSYKADVKTHRCANCDPARTSQYDPQMSEIGGQAVQHKSFRTANDIPQLSKNRHKGDID